MWLASVSYRQQCGLKGTSSWTPELFHHAEHLAHEALRGVGNPACERAFRMNITFCIHRAVSAREVERLPAEWSCSAGGLAGGPVEVLWSRGMAHRPAAMPCEAPGHLVIDQARPDLWVPSDCSHCEPCRARVIARTAWLEG